MKKSILALSLAVVLFSCKKEETKEFTTTDVTGTTVLKGTLSKNIVTPNGNGGWTTNTRIPVKGVAVSVKVNKNSLYPNSNALGADIYNGVSDSLGNYAITVKSNANGVNAQITIDGFTGTLDTVVNGVTKKGFYSTYSGTSQNRTLIMGQNSTLDHGFTANMVTGNPNTNIKIGTATITGSLAIQYLKEVMTGTLVTITTTYVPVAGRKVYLNFSNDPNTLATKNYEVTTDGSGYYSFEVTTVASFSNGFNQTANVWVADYATTRDTIKLNNSIKTGRAGVYSASNYNHSGVYNTQIRNATHLYYNSFQQN